jgi:predicted DNA-binding transcriptional regulator AlpA
VHDLLYNVKQIREDVAVPKNPEPEGSPRLMTVTEIAVEHGVSRQTIHTYRRTGVFPSPVEGEGSTRPRFREDEVAAFFEANPKQPRKKRIFPPKQQGELMSGELGLIKVRATSQGEVRWEAAGPAPEEIKYGTIVRGMSPAAARELAADLVRAANDAEASDG